MQRKTAWALAALLLIPASGRASDYCGHEQTAQPPKTQQAGKPGEKPGDKPADKAADKATDHRGTPKYWWIDPESRAELGITDAQSAAVEEVWQKSAPKLREGRTQLEKLEDALSEMIRSNAPETTVLAQIDKVEAMRAELSKARAVMIYRMNKVLTPEQRDKVKAKMERRDRDGGRRDPSSR